ncbi:MAG: hypothetical protein C0487_02040 [Leptothrix sp. (in: Bacteria)]|nr:hypothetical protein [Leptothrix sp. (in: b-proteobacteria)]
MERARDRRLNALSDRMSARPRERISAFLIEDDDGKPLRIDALRSSFDKAHRAAGVSFQSGTSGPRPLPTKGDLAHAGVLLGHKRREMTEHYVSEAPNR